MRTDPEDTSDAAVMHRAELRTAAIVATARRGRGVGVHPYKTCECGMVTTPGPMSRHQMRWTHMLMKPTASNGSTSN